jgi:hypothetical protein
MLAAMHLASIDDLADAEPVVEQMGKRSDAEADTAARGADPISPYNARASLG